MTNDERTNAASGGVAVPTFSTVPGTQKQGGWSATKQRRFISVLAQSGSVKTATAACGMSYTGVYKLRTMPGGESFAAAWDMALDGAALQVRDVVIDQTINGIPEPIVHNGEVVGERRRFNHRTMMWVLQHHMPERYPGVSTTKRRGWGEEKAAADAAELEEERKRNELVEIEEIERKLDLVALNGRIRRLLPYPEKRAAYEVLNGPVDWDRYEQQYPFGQDNGDGLDHSSHIDWTLGPSRD